MSSGGLHSLATIIKRLEAATSRLEDLAALNGAASAQQPLSASSYTASADSALPTPVPPPPEPSHVPKETPPIVVAFDERIIEGKLKPFVELTKSFAIQSVVDQVALVEKEYKDLRSLLLQATACKKPADDAALSKLLEPLQKDIQEITHAKETNRKDRDWFNHLNTIAEGGVAVGWVAVTPKPGPFVKDIKESTEFYANKVIKEWKEKEPKHAEWVRAFLGLLEELRKYIMDFHTTGLAWNANGVSIDQYQGTPSAPSAGGVPPPPPPPPPPVAPPPPPPPAGAAAPASGAGVAAVFAQINQGEQITKGLRKVDKSEMTHKNPALRAGSTVPASTTSAPAKKPIKPTKPHALAGKKPSKFALEGNKWLIEHFENDTTLKVEDGDKGQTVNIYGCKNSTIQVKGKVNAVNLVNSTKTSLLVNSVISSVSIMNSPSFALQITGTAPTIQLDSTDSGQIYLSKECLGVEIITAKSSSINVSLPVENEEEGVFEEHPIPEMFRTTVKEGKLVTTVVEHSG